MASAYPPTLFGLDLAVLQGRHRAIFSAADNKILEKFCTSDPALLEFATKSAVTVARLRNATFDLSELLAQFGFDSKDLETMTTDAGQRIVPILREKLYSKLARTFSALHVDEITASKFKTKTKARGNDTAGASSPRVADFAINAMNAVNAINALNVVPRQGYIGHEITHGTPPVFEAEATPEPVRAPVTPTTSTFNSYAPPSKIVRFTDGDDHRATAQKIHAAIISAHGRRTQLASQGEKLRTLVFGV
ncbi:hypothetical protein WAI453_013718 [Rhynchosporium graminicola]